jgi:hypothetical protein
MAVEVCGRWQVVCRHGVGDATMFARRSGCVRLAGWQAYGPIANGYVSMIWWNKFCADLKEARSVGRVWSLKCGKGVSSTVSLWRRGLRVFDWDN